MDAKNKKLKLLSFVGARPNFVKLAALSRECKKHPNIEHKIIHTGQHSQNNMNDIFFKDLKIDPPDLQLLGNGFNEFEFISSIINEGSRAIKHFDPDVVLIYGDVNGSYAAAFAAKRLSKKIAHIEAGLRSFDQNMPEELNRFFIDHISDYLFATEASAIHNLNNEKINQSKIHFVGNIMIDSLIWILEKIKNDPHPLGLERGSYILLTLHRPSNVDNKLRLAMIMEILERVAAVKKIIFPIHPRTAQKLNVQPKNIMIIDPQNYPQFIHMMRDCAFIITDSGGIQEESTFLGVQCLTARDNTERPETILKGTNHLCGSNFYKIEQKAMEILSGGSIKRGSIPILWDGKTAGRILQILSNDFFYTVD